MQNIFFPLPGPRFINKGTVIADLKDKALKIKSENNLIEAIYLFGSYATDNFSFRSDADLLIILKEDSRRILDRIDEYLLKFSDCMVPVDVLVYTRQEIDNIIESKNNFIKNALSGLRLV